MSILKIYLIDPPMDAFDGGITYFGIIWIFKQKLLLMGGTFFHLESDMTNLYVLKLEHNV